MVTRCEVRLNPKSWTGRLLHAAWHETDYDRAKKQLLTTVRWLQRLSPDAANSLRDLHSTR